MASSAPISVQHHDPQVSLQILHHAFFHFQVLFFRILFVFPLDPQWRQQPLAVVCALAHAFPHTLPQLQHRHQAHVRFAPGHHERLSLSLFRHQVLRAPVKRAPRQVLDLPAELLGVCDSEPGFGRRDAGADVRGVFLPVGHVRQPRAPEGTPAARSEQVRGGLDHAQVHVRQKLLPVGQNGAGLREGLRGRLVGKLEDGAVGRAGARKLVRAVGAPVEDQRRAFGELLWSCGKGKERRESGVLLFGGGRVAGQRLHGDKNVARSRGGVGHFPEKYAYQNLGCPACQLRWQALVCRRGVSIHFVSVT
mmetsp:Transcript_7238/g.17540  ORF Transcript_7238/g.17540 Transcript_7238/m.17540 type:complete len:307 (+) Transcript_7238:257-1177(+)